MHVARGGLLNYKDDLSRKMQNKNISWLVEVKLCYKKSELGVSFLLVKDGNLTVDKSILTCSLEYFIDWLKSEQ